MTDSPTPPLRAETVAFADGETLAVALAARVAEDLRTAIEERGAAVLAVSGGTTPKRFFEHLSRQPLAWDKVSVTLVDERWVGPDHDRSNARLVRETLLQDSAAAATFMPLYRDTAEPEEALPELERRLDSLPADIDVMVLGMGADGHTASFFPGGDYLAAALEPEGRARLLPMRAPGAGEPRITFTLPVLRAARHLYLHIEGAQKRAVLEAALAGADLPIRTVLEQAPATTVYLTA
ncbi:6-phosphogluconolactonase [Pseudoxanthomonas indica]|uniref:6-phosphogluconolactonase n=1 Tax=Pseudoxanthomonas indica TaxID=428993 RepID=A0A1T5KQX2_9GAMM|nr:6-phosphogluconolactonase [Pseudoxanthomonas indica]GGD50885.1 6-phosphogluconolactonase [Pseudoxanthomonas indica]SKC66097.1 6-phosphogluconolactonase [Pseudoxanthomonas indica]